MFQLKFDTRRGKENRRLTATPLDELALRGPLYIGLELKEDFSAISLSIGPRAGLSICASASLVTRNLTGTRSVSPVKPTPSRSPTHCPPLRGNLTLGHAIIDHLGS